MTRASILESLRLATEEETLGGGHAIIPLPPDDIPPVAVFRVLRERFGKPNHTWDAEKSLWGWALTGPNGVLTVHDWKGGWSIGFLGAREPSTDLAEDAEKLLGELQGLAKGRKLLTGSAAGGVIINPFRIYGDMSETLLDEAREVSNKIDARRAAVAGNRFTEKALDYADFIFGATARRRSLLIAAMLARIVSLEGFLNLVYHLFISPELADERVRVRIEREALDLKLRLVSTFCDCFEATPIDRNSDVYKAFNHLLSLRHNLAHGKLTGFMEDALVIEEERYPFVVPGSEAPAKYGISQDPLALDVKMVEETGSIVWTLVRQIMRAMKPQIRHSFVISHYYQEIAYRRDSDGRVEILLDPDDLRAPDEWIDEMLGDEQDDWEPADAVPQRNK